MHVPSAEELAAIAVAYLAVRRSEETPAPRETPRWRVAGRLDANDLDRVRSAVPSGSRWRIADRFDG
ncbi:MAG TPA: hypothetical protein VHS78_18390 [Candidatus Elarobacter sp.]|jgi:hypothetical protein|nr:hypothetical protein [Candidatus Elarobacter sp.]